jgi:hypothetical protein
MTALLNDSAEKTPLNPQQWAEIEELWAMGDSTLEELGARYDRNPSYLSRELSKRGVKKGSKAGIVQQRIKEAVHEDAVKHSAEVLRLARETKDEHYKFSRTISRIIFKLVADKIASGQPVSSLKDEIRVLKEAQQGIAIGRIERYALLGLDKDENAGEEKTTLVIEDMTEQDVAAERQRHAAGFDDEIDEIERAIEGMSDGVDSVSDQDG